MNVTAAVDPGIRVTAVSIFRGGSLTECGLVKNPAKRGSGPREAAQMGQAVKDWVTGAGHVVIQKLVVEVPQIYQRGGGRTKGNPNGLTPLFGVDTAIALLFPDAEVIAPYPRDWKGTVDGDAEDDEGDNAIIRQRVEERLTPDEYKVFRKAFESLPKSVAHNLPDSVGIGLWSIGRFSRKRVYHRVGED